MCRKKQHVRVDDMKERSDLICGKAAVGGNYNSTHDMLASCYFNTMKLALEYGIRTIAFPSISTGVYSFPVELAAKIAVKTVSRFMNENPDSFELVEWVLFDDETERIYEGEVDKLYTDM